MDRRARVKHIQWKVDLVKSTVKLRTWVVTAIQIMSSQISHLLKQNQIHSKVIGGQIVFMLVLFHVPFTTFFKLSMRQPRVIVSTRFACLTSNCIMKNWLICWVSMTSNWSCLTTATKAFEFQILKKHSSHRLMKSVVYWKKAANVVWVNIVVIMAWKTDS